MVFIFVFKIYLYIIDLTCTKSPYMYLAKGGRFVSFHLISGIWGVLSDEQMRMTIFPILNDELMSNKVRVEHQPAIHICFFSGF